MIRISDNVKCMASLATFRKMVQDHKSIYDVVAELSGQIIIENGLHTIDLGSLRRHLKEDAGVDVPTSIVKASVKRLDYVNFDKGLLTINERLTVERQNHVLAELNANKEKDNRVFDSLMSFIEEKLHNTLSAEERTFLKEDFCSYIVDDSYNTKYAELISNFILSKKDEDDFGGKMRQIREGMIILLGLSYNVNEEQIDIVDTSLCLYLETELLFHMAGYNGELFKSFFEEFYAQVEAINKKAGKALVKLFYFEETLQEIDRYFKTAEDIIEKKARLDYTKTAMRTIVEGCIERYDVLQKKAEFMKLLTEKNILLDKQSNYYEKENFALNVEEQKIIDELVNEGIDRHKAYEKLRLINYIFIKRGNKFHQYFRNVGHILVSANSLTFNVAKHTDLHNQNDVPLAWSIDRLTSRFWLTLNRGLIPSTQLRSFDLISKARVVLSNKVNSSVERLFYEIDSGLKDGTLTKEKAILGIIELRKNCVTPDEINEDEVDSYLAIINEDSIQHVIAEIEERDRKNRGIIDSQANKLKEKEGSLVEINTRKGIAVKMLLEKENEEIRQSYQEAMSDYKDNLETYVEDAFQKLKKRHTKRVCWFVICVIVLFALSVLLEGKIFWGYIFVSFIIFFLPFIRPMIDHKPIKDSFLFLFSKEKCDKAKSQLKEEYEQNNKRPELHLKSDKDIEEELEKYLTLQDDTT